ncbi:hypothetical protein [Polyangium spumosum]|uniref:Uncharacterized protein n=1 Tax=Polyangium spumosum TaxID=889282 RepID=A0A6N7PQW6_9BACT|nr:hypothetical protein [Polyangium spumosum]MRG91241.1 hypothetical protein [Polyangium spumosum]
MTSQHRSHAASPRGAGAFVGLSLGAAMGARRLAGRGVVLTALLALALALAGGLIERRVTTAGAVDRSLAATFRLVVPLFCFALAARACDRSSLRDAAWPVARYGAARRDVALGIGVALVLVSAVSGALLALVAVASAQSPSAPPFARDAFTSGWIGALVGAAYAGWFSFGATFFERGRGRVVPLVLDFLFGSGAGLFAALLPRAHGRGLLGGEGPLGLSQPHGSIALLLMATLLPVAAALRCRE